MLIKALCDYADKQTALNDSRTVPDGWGTQEVDYRILLTSDGDIADIIDIRTENKIVAKNGKEKITYARRKVVLPFRGKSTSISCYCGEHRPYYIFGLDYDKGSFRTESDKDKARKSHAAYIKHELEFYDGLDSEICVAYRKFVEKWMPENEIDNAALSKIGKNYGSSYFCFGLSGLRGNLEDDEQFKNRYQEYIANISADKAIDTSIGACGILGEKLPIARIHENIKFPGGNSSGCVLVGMKESAFTSYGKTQSFNSNVSEEAMKKYTDTFNRLLADKNHHAFIGDMVIIYFAMKNNDSAECDLFSCFFDSGSSDQTEQSINKLMKYAQSGYTTDSDSLSELETDPDVTFYIAGFTPNSSRICQKFIYRDKFGSLMKNLMKHQSDLKINEDNNRPVYFWGISKQLVSPKSSKENQKVPPPLMTNIMLSAFNNTKYPDGLLSTVIKRVKTDNDEEKNPFIKLNDIRAGVIKACLNRKYQREEITMAWNDENKNPAYLCGGLFAVYEKIQQDSSGGNLNRTIKDAYFASACARPSSVFPKLAKLAQNHMRKLSEGSCVYYNKLIGSITDGLECEFPSTLCLDDQGRFIVGYYQMNKKLFTSTKND